MMKKSLLLATNNPNKVVEVKRMLGERIEVVTPSSYPDISEPVEDGSTFLENAKLKAEHYALRTGMPALADDSGLVIDSLGGAPGIYSARYAETPQARIDRVLKEMSTITNPALRSARFVCAMALVIPGKTDFQATSCIAVVGTVEGQIIDTMRGSGGFGYDPIFYLPSFNKTMAELSMEEKNAISHRGKALATMQLLMYSAI
ncbi:MAG: RdgB/HAM1 family non-canonical purine NTP pyrophosphatase [Candidatus Sumerlaeales bacterium]|nr:RdgB/HAM1 family non-canonical purine NTP pyrophosphatase [Candidatus Sumerlaeales bacterium]